MVSHWLDIASFDDLFHHFLFAALICSARMLGAFSIFQATAKQVLQGRVRIGLVTILAFYVGAGLPSEMLSKYSGASFFILALKEAFVGLLLGYMAATVFWVAEGVGAMIDNVAGYNSVQQQNPLTSSQSTPISLLLSQLCVTLFYVFGGFIFLLSALFETYRWWPVDSMTPIPAAFLERFVIAQTDTLMTQIVKIASPVLVVMVLIDISFGLVAKTAGKLEPNSLAQPVKSATALLVVMLSLGAFIEQLTVAISLADLKQALHVWMTIGSGAS